MGVWIEIMISSAAHGFAAQSLFFASLCLINVSWAIFSEFAVCWCVYGPGFCHTFLFVGNCGLSSPAIFCGRQIQQFVIALV